MMILFENYNTAKQKFGDALFAKNVLIPRFQIRLSNDIFNWSSNSSQFASVRLSIIKGY
jgi:hypothetical protein